MPVAGIHITAHKICKRRKRYWFPHGEPGDYCERRQDWQCEIRTFLQRIVLALVRMLATHEQVEPDHFSRITNITAPRHEVAPLAMQIDEYRIRDTVQHEQPHHREVPVACARKPAAECCPMRD